MLKSLMKTHDNSRPSH